ncbi:MAG TPA: hypothetical protein VMV94_17225, partial [Phycisphaerae bacterium]|nr:hypothetical protein [Phycisphaerae bacterium]
MKKVCAAVALVFALQLCAAPASAAVKKCGNGKIDPGEQCEPVIPANQPSSLDAACPGMCLTNCKCPTATTSNLTTTKAKPADTPGTKGVKAKDVYPQL